MDQKLIDQARKDLDALWDSKTPVWDAAPAVRRLTEFIDAVEKLLKKP